MDILETKKRSGVYYGYIIVAASFLIITLAYGAEASFGVFFKPMSGEFGWGRAETSGPFSIYIIVSGLLTIISGNLSDRFGPRKLVSIGGVILGLGYLLMSQINSLWQLYLFYTLLAGVGISTIYVPLVTLIARWFTKKRGLACGIGTCGIPFGIVVIPPIASRIIEGYHWRIPLLALGGVLIVAIALLGQLLKKAPESEDPSAQQQNPGGVDGLSFNQAIRSKPFWMVGFAFLLYGYFYEVAAVHIVPYATDLGISAVAAATILTVIGVTGTIGRLTLGIVGEKRGNLNTAFISCLLMGLCFVILILGRGTWPLYLFAVIFGYLTAVGLLLVPILAEYFGLKSLGIISGAVFCCSNIGAAIGPPAAGGIFDITGSYQLAFISSVIAGLVAGLILWILKVLGSRSSNL
jgi:MFS transporter, OFA family, oxalate/formate antiporter